MQDLKVTSWQLFGHDRLYVNLPDGTAIGWADLANGTITVLHPRYRDAVTDALARQVPHAPALSDMPPPGPPPSAPPPMPRIPPLRRTRKRDPGERAGGGPAGERPVAEGTAAERPAAERPVAEGPAGGQAVAVGEAAAPRVPQQRPAVATETEGTGVRGYGPLTPVVGERPLTRHDDEQMPASAPGPEYRQGGAPASPPTPAPGQATHRYRVPAPAPVPPGRFPRPLLPELTPANDLAARRPGAALRARPDASGTGALVRAATGALRRRKDVDPRLTALAGERRVGAELRRLTRHGWRVLHSVPLPDGTELGHLLIGPGGVFAVHAEHHPGARVRVEEGTWRIGDGAPRPWALADRPGAADAQRVLETHCAFPVPVHTVLVFVGVTTLDVIAAPPGVRVYRDRQVSALAPLTGVLTPTQVEKVYDVARRREAWSAG
ncbi:NERD domain-containing protein [Streptomyces sp. NPDC005899]|uniref:NERD domain-containing protein n=1 Tax=Streptomyces sp. NPDC005899 TaxID=3155716 RepID=UPI0033F8B4FB